MQRQNVESRLITFEEPKSQISEAFRTLRTNIQFASAGNNVKVILVTSSCMGEGKSTISSNLATVFAQQGKTVLLIDADMRRGRLHNIFGVSTKNGLSNYLADMEWEEKTLINSTNVENLYLVSSGNVPPNPSELLSSDRMLDLINQCKKNFDIIILDGPPCLVVADGLILARYADTTLIASAYKETHKEELKNTKKAIENVGGKIGGVILNKMDVTQHSYSHYGYYGYYAKEGKEI